METIEDIILRHSGRGMDILRPALPEDHCRRAAELLLSLPRGRVLMTTGFCVNEHAETDGPAGTWAVARALRAIGHTPVIVTDAFCEGIFEQEGLETVYFPMDGGRAEAEAILAEQRPVALFSLERCGLNAVGDYMNMRGRSIRERTAPVDALFLASEGRVPSIGIGDGGNEIGMGNVADLIAERLPLIPCVVRVDELVIATVSNWGGYGICAHLAARTGLPLTVSFDEYHSFMERAARFGCVDGISGLPELTEDGFPPEVTREILEALERYVQEKA